MFGPYLLLQTLGEGEFAKVKLGMHAETGEEVKHNIQFFFFFTINPFPSFSLLFFLLWLQLLSGPLSTCICALFWFFSITAG